jgi:hypothetical protein
VWVGRRRDSDALSLVNNKIDKQKNRARKKIEEWSIVYVIDNREF